MFEILNLDDIDLANPVIGPRLGITDALLGDRVEKPGRTTGYTTGDVEEVFASVDVGYGSGKVATYDNQIVIRGVDGSEFSAGGDSGSGIYKAGTGLMCGVLFAGGGGTTIANRVSDFSRILDIRL